MAAPRSPSSASRQYSRSVTPKASHASSNNPFVALSNSSSDESDDILRPRGRIAARMQTSGSAPQDSDVEVSGDANSTRGNDAGSTGGQGDSGDDGDDGDDVVSTRPRKPKSSRRQRSSTPESRPQAAATPSPGLFVSPPNPRSLCGQNGQSEDELPSPAALTKNPRFLALVAKKREQRLAREAEEARKKAARRKAPGHDGDDDIMADDEDEDAGDITDDEGGRKLTQEVAAARVPRKASKKALEEMNRETQRLTRSLQLAHEAKVKKKITKATLFERFNFKPEGSAARPEKTEPAPSSSGAPTPGSAPQSDAEMKDAETPPSSPPPAAKGGQLRESSVSARAVAERHMLDNDADDFPTLVEISEAASARKKLDKGKGKATAADLELDKQPASEPPRKRSLRVKLPPIPANGATLSLDDDDGDDLQIQPTRKSKLDAIFDRAPLNQSKEPRALQLLRRLAQLDDPDKKGVAPVPERNKRQKQNQQPSMTVGELQATLLQRARQQAKLERDRHLEMLKAKGVHVQTAEERERELQEVEDIVAKARKEAEEIMQREREAAKLERKKRREAGEVDPLGWDDSDGEEEYAEENEQEEADIELSGSEEEGEEEREEEEEGGEDEDVEEEGDEAENGPESAAQLVDEAAAEGGRASETEDAGEPDVSRESDEEPTSAKPVRRRPRKQVTILSDDDEDDAEPLVKATPRPKGNLNPKSPSTRNAESPSAPTSVLRSATKTFIPGLPVAGPAGLGLTQIFAGTMDDSQTGTAPVDSPSQPRPTFDAPAFPDSNFSQTAQEVAEDRIVDSQLTRETQQVETQGVQIRFSQSQTYGFDTLLQATQIPTQTSDIIEPTQDAGFRNFSPLRQRFVEAPTSTVATVPVARDQAGEGHNESPLLRRAGKLRRKADVVPASPSRRSAEHDEPTQEPETDEFGFGTVTNDAFAAMKAAALKEKKRKEAFDRKKSKAREMVEEQAEESEDEYAGLGGADGEDSSDDDDQSVKEMIDDETKNDESDERRLAAFYADRERASDEKQVEKLFHDITTGMLRRKRNGNWDDLSDSDDGGEARRRMKRRQFAKMQRALFADERISKVAENPRNLAFLRTIEDRGSDDDMDFILAPPPAPARLQSQDSVVSTTGQAAVIPNSQPPDSAAPRPHANSRRTKESKKPSSLAEIRESLSNLLDEPLNLNSSSSLIPATELESSEEDEADGGDARPQTSHDDGSPSGSNKENPNPVRKGRQACTTPTVIDRITLKRGASAASNSASKLAFASASSGSGAGNNGSGSGSAGGFRVPALLRRATTNSSLLSAATSSSSASSSSASITTATRTRSPTGDVTTATSSTSPAAAMAAMKIRKPPGRRSGVSYLARENERRAALAEAERRREARKVRGAEGRVKVVGGLFGAGEFE